jgi:hypothetical protein
MIDTGVTGLQYTHIAEKNDIEKQERCAGWALKKQCIQEENDAEVTSFLDQTRV